MTAEEKKAVSERVTASWADRRKESREVARRGRDEYVPGRGRCILLTRRSSEVVPATRRVEPSVDPRGLVARLGGRRHRPPPAGTGSVVNRCGGGWSAVADAPSAPRGSQVQSAASVHGTWPVRPRTAPERASSFHRESSDDLRRDLRCRIPASAPVRNAPGQPPWASMTSSNLGHDADGLVQSDDDLLVVGDVLVR